MPNRCASREPPLTPGITLAVSLTITLALPLTLAMIPTLHHSIGVTFIVRAGFTGITIPLANTTTALCLINEYFQIIWLVQSAMKNERKQQKSRLFNYKIVDVDCVRTHTHTHTHTHVVIQMYYYPVHEHNSTLC